MSKNTPKPDWAPFYNEFAHKLLKYKDDRKPLLDWIYSNEWVEENTYLHNEGNKLQDIDPFTVIGMLNRDSPKKKPRIVASIKDYFNIKSVAPENFDGIPTLYNTNSHFFKIEKNGYDNIDNLWDLFEKALDSPYDIEEFFNIVINEYSEIKTYLTMGLFWILPDFYIALDKTNISYLKNVYNIKSTKKLTEFKDYKKIIDEIKEKMESGEIKENSFIDISVNAYAYKGKNEIDEEMGEQNRDNLKEDNTKYNDIVNIWRYKKNLIIHGAPGTGKTYMVPELVVRLCNNDSYKTDSAKLNRDDIIKEYKDLIDNKRVVFTTFHQSFDYEDFVEGIKAKVDDNGNVSYEVKDGIFKNLCNESLDYDNVLKNYLSKAKNIWKFSLKQAGPNDLREDCLKNNYIRISYKEKGEDNEYIEDFKSKIKKGDIILSCFSNKEIDAIGVVTSDYYIDNTKDDYKHFRNVKWLVKDIKENIFKQNNYKEMAPQTFYPLEITKDDVFDILINNKDKLTKKDEPYVLVIDEINRGNVSKIFGELITLLEADKRLGEESEIKVKLPYSNDMFAVPSNVYVIATMNTADRSLDTLDYAIRRRFAFLQSYPEPLDIEGFNKDLFKKVISLFINNKDEYLENKYLKDIKIGEIPEASDCLSDEFNPLDVCLGHSYFIMKDNDEMKYKINNEIIPILLEYLNDGVFKNEITVNNAIKELRYYAENGKFKDDSNDNNKQK